MKSFLFIIIRQYCIAFILVYNRILLWIITYCNFSKCLLCRHVILNNFENRILVGIADIQSYLCAIVHIMVVKLTFTVSLRWLFQLCGSGAKTPIIFQDNIRGFTMCGKGSISIRFRTNRSSSNWTFWLSLCKPNLQRNFRKCLRIYI